MIAFLTGRVAAKSLTSAVLDVNGVGYRLHMATGSLSSLPAVGDEVTVQTHLHVREDELTLFGFGDPAEREAFELLLTVSGVGPKVALGVLSTLSAEELARAVAGEDVAVLSSVPGIGRKTAQRIILDLADKMAASPPGSRTGRPDASAEAEAREALLSMGFSAAEVAVALKGAPTGSDSSVLLAFGLKRLGGGS